VFIPDNVWVATNAERPYVLTPHGGYNDNVIRGHNRIAKALWLRIRERRYVRGASLVHAVSAQERHLLRKTFGEVTLQFIPNAVDLPASPVRPDVRRRTSPKRVVFLGRLAIDHKGLDLLLEGYARHIEQSSDQQTELVIAGPDFRDGLRRLRTIAASLGLRSRIHFPGPRYGPDQESLFESAYVFVHTSRWEGMPLAVLEAMASGCPVLITAATNLAQYVDDFGAGVVVEGSAEGIADGLTHVLGAPVEQYDAMCSAARNLVAQRFTWPRVATEMAAAYRGVLSPTRHDS
jgi:glycosyltransferase involved in cell wall biosynthesis